MFYDEKYSFLLDNYFVVNRKVQPFLEDIFVNYVRFLEGYSIRETEDDKIRERIKGKIKEIEEDIKSAIREPEIKEKIESSIKEVFPNWTLNKSHSSEIARWISDGYIEKVSLETRLQKLDSTHLKLIAKNKTVLNKHESVSEEEYYRKIVCTRNYYSHFKEDDAGILTTSEMEKTVRVLKSLILLIIYEKMGMDISEASKILIRDSELVFETKCLLTDDNKDIRAANAIDAQVIK